MAYRGRYGTVRIVLKTIVGATGLYDLVNIVAYYGTIGIVCYIVGLLWHNKHSMLIMAK